MPDADLPDCTIVGSGLAGALLACYLGKAGRRVDLYERRPDPRLGGPERGRSINLALSLRGITALNDVGLADAVLGQSIPMRGRMIHSPNGDQTFQPYGKDESQVLYSVSRAGLNLLLIEAAAAYPAIRLNFNRRCWGVDLKARKVELSEEGKSADGGANDQRRPDSIPFELLIGADGAYSAVRATLQKQERFNYQQDYLSHGYKELTIPAGPGGTFQMEKNALHIWPRRSFMMIALPNNDGSFTCTLFWAHEGPNSFEAIKTEPELIDFFKHHFCDALQLMPTVTQDYFHNPVGSLVTVRCSPWHIGGHLVLLGDAAHAVVPFLGQGMNAAFEDCSILAKCFGKKDPREAVLAEFERLRKVDTDALADMAVDNFLEMRDRVASRWFRLRKKAQIFLYKMFPTWYVPLYNLIQFTTTPYAEARKRARAQEGMIPMIGAGVLMLLTAIFMWIIWLK